MADINSFANWPLTSFPGSGITWTRQIIEGVTGFYTGSWIDYDPSPILLPSIFQIQILQTDSKRS